MIALPQRQLIEYSAASAFYIKPGKLFVNLSSFLMEIFQRYIFRVNLLTSVSKTAYFAS